MQTVIIGAGILGASTAFHLAREGTGVTVIDAGYDGRATAAGAGIICPWVSGAEDDAFYRLYAGGGEYYPDLVAALAEAGETDLGYRKSGAMLVSADAEDLSWLERMAMQRRQSAPAMGEVTRLSHSAARTLFPPLHPDLGAVHVSGGARVDGRRLAAALLRAAQRHGAAVRHGQATLRPGGGIELDGDAVPADRVVVTAGAWADRLLRPAGVAVPVAPQRGQITHFQMQQTATGDWPVILPPGSHYIVPFDDGRIVAGATRETGLGFDYRVTAAGQMEVLSEALRIAPGLAAAGVIQTRVGFRPVTTRARPLLGWLPELPRVAIGNGLGAAGLTIGPFAGCLLAELVMDRTPRLSLGPFDPGREAAAADEPVALR